MAFDKVSLKGTDPQYIAGCGEAGADWVIFEVSQPSNDFSAVPQGQFAGSSSPPQNCVYYNMLVDHKTGITPGTPITQAGVYGAFLPCMSLYLTPSAGSATVNWQVPR